MTYERARRDFNATLLLNLGVAGRLRSLEVSRVVTLHLVQGPGLVTCQHQVDVLQQASVTRRAARRKGKSEKRFRGFFFARPELQRYVQDEAVAVQPQRVARVVAHGFAEQGDADGSCAHRRSGMATFVGLDDVGGETADSRQDERIRGNLR